MFGKYSITKTTTSSKSNSYQTNEFTESENIIFAVLTSNLSNVKKYINKTNINDIIDNTNDYRALHHAVRIRGNDMIIEYLINLGANPYLKQSEGMDCIDLSIEANYRYLIDKLMRKKDFELNEIQVKHNNLDYEYENLKKTNSKLEEENAYLKKSSSQYSEKIELLRTENRELKRKYQESEKAFDNLLKKFKK